MLQDPGCTLGSAHGVVNSVCSEIKENWFKSRGSGQILNILCFTFLICEMEILIVCKALQPVPEMQ